MVMFLHISVILFMGGGVHPSHNAMGQRVHPGVYPGWEVHPGGASRGWMHPLPQKTGGKQAGGTHPTGMHTC